MSVRKIDYDSLRYTQEYFYPYFSNGKMSVSETYIILANGFLDPASLAPITIFEFNEHLYCIDTRRLTIAKNLQRTKKLDILKRFPFQYVKKGDNEFADRYLNLVDDRLPAMKKKGLDGSKIKLYPESDYMCCYNLVSGNFRDDLDEHIAHDHLRMSFLEFKNLNISQCSRCNQKTYINFIKPSNKSSYIFRQNCSCQNSEPLVLHIMKKPWTEVTLREICDVFLCLNQTALYLTASLKNVVKSVNSKEVSNEFTISSTRQVPLNKSSSYNNRHTKEIEADGFIKQFRLFFLRFFFIAILSWLIFIFFKLIDS
jgi:hypothetical protein